MEQKGFNAGLRLSLVMDRLNLTQNQLAGMVNGGQSTISNWMKMEKFSKVIVARLQALEELGININYFVAESAPMMLAQVTKSNPEESIRILQDENTQLKRKVVFLEKKLKKCEEGAE